MKNENGFLFGIRVDELEIFLASAIAESRKRVMQNTDIALYQGINDISVIDNEINAEFETLKSEVSRSLIPEIEKISQVIVQSDITELETQTELEVQKLDQRTSNLEVDIKRTKLTYNWSLHKIWLIAILILSSIDTLMNYSSLQTIANSLIASIGLSLFVAFGLAFVAHTIGKRMQKAVNIYYKLFWFLTGAVGGCLAFYGLGLLRQTYIGDSTLISNLPIVWVLISNFFFISAILIAYTKLPTDAQEEEKAQMDSLQKDLLKLEIEKKKLISKLKDEVDRINAEKQKLEAFKIYKNELLIKLDLEKDYLNASSKKEYILKSGGKVIISNQIKKLK